MKSWHRFWGGEASILLSILLKKTALFGNASSCSVKSPPHQVEVMFVLGPALRGLQVPNLHSRCRSGLPAGGSTFRPRHCKTAGCPHQ